MAERDIKIKDAPLVEQVRGTEKIPCSNGSGNAVAITPEQITAGVENKIKQTNASVDALKANLQTLDGSLAAEVARAQGAESALSGEVAEAKQSVSDETTRANEAESALSDKIDAVGNKLTEESERAKAAEEANATQIADNKVEIGKLADMIYALSAETVSVGFARENGSSDPNGEIFFGTDELFDKISSHFHLGTFGHEGELVKQAKDGYLTVAVDGSEIAIDGTMGDVGVFTDVSIYKLCETMMIGGREMNVLAFGLNPFSWYGKTAKEIKPFALSADGTVNAKVGDDVRSQAHTIFNRSVVGSYSTPQPIFKGSYIKSGAGYHTQGVSCVDSIKNAQNKNASATDNRPYISGYYEYFEVLAGMILAGCKSTTHTQLTHFGSGCTPMDAVKENTFNDAAISGSSGWKVMTADGTAYYTVINGNGYFKLNAESTSKFYTIQGVNGNYSGICEILEAQRLLDGIQKAGLTSYVGSNANIFVMDENDQVSVITDGSVNVTDGTGMEALKHYYIVRDVPSFRGLSAGRMTALVNSYTKFEFADGVLLASNDTDLTGGTAILKRSVPVLFGWALPYHGYFVQSDGAYYIINRDADDALSIEYRAASSVDNIPPRISFGYQTTFGGETDIEVGLDKRLYDISYGFNTEAWAKGSNYSMSMFCHTIAGGSSRAYESAYLWVYASTNGGNNTRQLHGSVLGCSNIYDFASVRTANCVNHAGDGRGVYAGSWSLPYPKLNNK